MSNAQYVFPELRLSQQLKAAGGLPVVEALDAAQTNLKALQPECLAELRSLTAEASGCFARFPDAFTAPLLKDLYAIASRGVGSGAVAGIPAADTALISLCDLLDHMTRAGRWDKEAVAVHVKTLEVLVSTEGQAMSDQAASAVLLGLTKVSARYAQHGASAEGAAKA